MSFRHWDSKTKRPENISGHSKKSGVLFELMPNQISFRVKRDFKKLMTNLCARYQEIRLSLDYTFQGRVIRTCVNFTRQLKRSNPGKKVFMRPLFVAVVYQLLRIECRQNDFMVDLRKIMRFVNPPNSRKFKTKMVLYYLNEFKSATGHPDLISKRPGPGDEPLRPDQRKISQIFRITKGIFQKISKEKKELNSYYKEVEKWIDRIFFYREGLVQVLLCKRVKNVGLGLLFLALTMTFPHLQMNLTEFLKQVDQRSEPAGDAQDRPETRDLLMPGLMDIMPFDGNYYTVCATIGTITHYFEDRIIDVLDNRDRFFEFLCMYKRQFLFKLIGATQSEASSEDSERGSTPKRGSGRRRRIPNKLSKQRSRFLIKSAFKLDKIRWQFESVSREQCVN